jgi:hypothetical protein
VRPSRIFGLMPAEELARGLEQFLDVKETERLSNDATLPPEQRAVFAQIATSVRAMPVADLETLQQTVEMLRELAKEGW